MIKEDIVELFNNFHETGQFVRCLNSTSLILIPKNTEATSIKDFRLISLMGIMYKLLAKLLARKIAKVMEKVVGEC